MMGRAGRPQYDTFGEGIIITGVLDSTHSWGDSARAALLLPCRLRSGLGWLFALRIP